jgi:hypothetical protein
MGLDNLRFKPAYNPYTEVTLSSYPSPPRSNSPLPNKALPRNIRFPSPTPKMGRNREQRDVQTRDVITHGTSQRRSCFGLGVEFGETHYDSVSEITLDWLS